MLTVLEDLQNTLHGERLVALRRADILIQTSLHELLLLLTQPRDLLREVRDGEVEDE